MKVTLLADASYCPETGIAGYGYWIASQRGKAPGQGVMRERVGDSGTAEMRAVCYALHGALQAGLVRAGDEVLIQVDCESAIQAFTFRRTTLKKEEQDTQDYFQKLTRDHSLCVIFKHVKGHSNLADARSLSNNACDRRARSAMRQARDRFLSTQHQEVFHEAKTSPDPAA